MATTPRIEGGGVLGETVQGPRRQLDVFDLPKFNDNVEYFSDEVMSFCPVTGQPDWYTVAITLFGSKRGLESKALKLYLQSFNDPEEGMFCEAFASRICNDVWTAISDGKVPLPVVTVEVVQKPRGGISITSTSSQGAPGGTLDT